MDPNTIKVAQDAAKAGEDAASGDTAAGGEGAKSSDNTPGGDKGATDTAKTNVEVDEDLFGDDDLDDIDAELGDMALEDAGMK